jgi:hypothetical protein
MLKITCDMAETTWLDGNYSIIEDEAISLFEAMKAMEQRRISHVIFETDSKSDMCVICVVAPLFS